jgi:hypothetical protein
MSLASELDPEDGPDDVADDPQRVELVAGAMSS